MYGIVRGGPGVNVIVFDTRVGNVHSLCKALEAGGARVRVEGDPARLLDGDALVLPGVGAFGAAAERLAPAAASVRDALLDGFPALGICLGMQLLLEASEEGPGAGLGVVPGRVRRLRARRVPHMGWNAVEPVARAAAVGRDGVDSSAPGSVRSGPPGPGAGAPGPVAPDTHGSGPGGTAAGGAVGGRVDPLFGDSSPLVAYYAHSFVAEPADAARVIAWTEYDGERFPAAVRAANAWGVQFHPEKSGGAGVRLIRNFLREAGR